MGDPVVAPLQLSLAAVLALSTVDLVLLVSDYVTILVSFGIAYVAYRGYRRNDSRPMLFVAAGFLLAFWAPPALLLTYLATDLVATFSPELEESVPTAIAMAGDLSRIAGFVCILYGLAMPGSGER